MLNKDVERMDKIFTVELFAPYTFMLYNNTHTKIDCSVC